MELFKGKILKLVKKIALLKQEGIVISKISPM